MVQNPYFQHSGSGVHSGRPTCGALSDAYAVGLGENGFKLPDRLHGSEYPLSVSRRSQRSSRPDRCVSETWHTTDGLNQTLSW